ncbi:hypothetical protein ACN2CX_07990 [Aliarcobacter butzleri]|uniref:hypothetical protein n=1 Tax=Aliarcobacter butzleri TaxID=28197 RepID=UPI003AFA6A4F
MIKNIFVFFIVFSSYLYANNEKDSVFEVKEFLIKTSNYLKEQINLKKSLLMKKNFLKIFQLLEQKI